MQDLYDRTHKFGALQNVKNETINNTCEIVPQLDKKLDMRSTFQTTQDLKKLENRLNKIRPVGKLYPLPKTVETSEQNTYQI